MVAPGHVAGDLSVFRDRCHYGSGRRMDASIVAEAVSWGDTKVTAQGLGAYIAENTAAGDYPKIVLGIAVMSMLVTLFNRLLWRPLDAYAEDRLRLD
jgi:NitT/TauT family transport system permease protein